MNAGASAAILAAVSRKSAGVSPGRPTITCKAVRKPCPLKNRTAARASSAVCPLFRRRRISSLNVGAPISIVCTLYRLRSASTSSETARGLTDRRMAAILSRYGSRSWNTDSIRPAGRPSRSPP